MQALTKTITGTATGFTDFISMLSGTEARLMAGAVCAIRVVDPTTGSH